MQEYDAKQLQQYLADTPTPPLLLDVREPWEYDVCKLENSQLIPMGRISHAYADLDPTQETVVICHHGIRSRMVAMFLERQGFSKVINLRGGVDEWAKQVDSHMPTY